MAVIFQDNAALLRLSELMGQVPLLSTSTQRASARHRCLQDALGLPFSNQSHRMRQAGLSPQLGEDTWGFVILLCLLLYILEILHGIKSETMSYIPGQLSLYFRLSIKEEYKKIRQNPVFRQVSPSHV